MQSLPFQPEQASTIAKSVDQLYFFLTAVTLFFTALIFSIIFYFMIATAGARRTSGPRRSKARFRSRCFGRSFPR
jgi:heme/copper-type cytochrome/quinol oxidase subunit 2